jgi:multimeric flavodoxin WrbA
VSRQHFSADRANANYLDISKEQEHAFAVGHGPDDILTEQRKVADADLVIFHFPVWWFSMPAILKGWFDRVFSRGFAYSKGRKYGTGHFQGKRAISRPAPPQRSTSPTELTATSCTCCGRSTTESSPTPASQCCRRRWRGLPAT